MNDKRTHIVIPDRLAEEIDTLVGKRGRSSFLAQAAWREVKRLRLLHSIKKASGAWKDKDHPELKGGSARYIAELREEWDQRLERLAKP